MGFEKFGKVTFAPYTKVSSFVDKLKGGSLEGTKCRKCSSFFFPPRADCPKCLTSEMDWLPVPGRGKLLTHITVHAAPTGFEKDAPYTIGVIELEGGGKLMAWVEGLSESELKIGMELKVTPKPLLEDRIMYVLGRP
jgi:uncharacterized OB-fold protein